MKKLLGIAVVSACLTMSSSLCASIWTAVGSSGAIDEASLPIYDAHFSVLGYKSSSTSTAPIIARYNVVNINHHQPVPTEPGWKTFEMGYFDNATNSVVNAVLFQVDPCTGKVTAICHVSSFDSTVATCNKCSLTTTIDFAKYLYYIEVRIGRSANGAPLPTPRLHTLRLY